MKTNEHIQELSQQLQQIYEDCLILPEYQREQLIILLALSRLNDRHIKEVITSAIKERGVSND